MLMVEIGHSGDNLSLFHNALRIAKTLRLGIIWQVEAIIVEASSTQILAGISAVAIHGIPVAGEEKKEQLADILQKEAGQ